MGVTVLHSSKTRTNKRFVRYFEVTKGETGRVLHSEVDFMNIYTETAGKLDKLRLNETQMSQEQFVRYASVLKKYRREIITGANEILSHF